MYEDDYMDAVGGFWTGCIISEKLQKKYKYPRLGLLDTIISIPIVGTWMVLGSPIWIGHGILWLGRDVYRALQP